MQIDPALQFISSQYVKLLTTLSYDDNVILQLKKDQIRNHRSMRAMSLGCFKLRVFLAKFEQFCPCPGPLLVRWDTAVPRGCSIAETRRRPISFNCNLTLYCGVCFSRTREVYIVRGRCYATSVSAVEDNFGHSQFICHFRTRCISPPSPRPLPQPCPWPRLA